MKLNRNHTGPKAEVKKKKIFKVELIRNVKSIYFKNDLYFCVKEAEEDQEEGVEEEEADGEEVEGIVAEFTSGG